MNDQTTSYETMGTSVASVDNRSGRHDEPRAATQYKSAGHKVPGAGAGTGTQAHRQPDSIDGRNGQALAAADEAALLRAGASYSDPTADRHHAAMGDAVADAGADNFAGEMGHRSGLVMEPPGVVLRRVLGLG